MEMKISEHETSGLYLKTIRLIKNYTLKELADRLYISESLLSKIESGERTISPDILNKLLNLYEINLESFDEEVYAIIESLLKSFIMCQNNTIQKELDLNINKISFPYVLFIRFIQLFLTCKDSPELPDIVNILTKTIELYESRYQQIFFNLNGYLYLKKKDFENAKISIQKGIEINADESFTALGYYYLSFIKRDIHELKHAINYSEKAIEYYNKANNVIRLSKAFGHLGSLYLNIGLFTTAIEFYEKSESNNTLNDIDICFAVKFNKGLCYLELGKFEKAIDNFLNAKSIKKNCNTCFYLSYCYFKLNDKKKAKIYVEEGHTANEFDYFSVCMLNWLEAMLNSKYSKKCEFHLLKLNKKYLDLSLTDKRFLNNRLSEYYEYHEDYKQANCYLKRNN